MITSRYSFTDIFDIVGPQGLLVPKIRINVNGAILPRGVALTRGLLYGGINFYNYLDTDIAGEIVSETFLLGGFFNK